MLLCRRASVAMGINSPVFLLNYPYPYLYKSLKGIWPEVIFAICYNTVFSVKLKILMSQIPLTRKSDAVYLFHLFIFFAFSVCLSVSTFGFFQANGAILSHSLVMLSVCLSSWSVCLYLRFVSSKRCHLESW